MPVTGTTDDKLEFYSCSWINNSITFFKESLSFCCGGMKEPLFDYHGEPFPVDKFLARKNQLLEDIQLGKDNPCKGCSKLVKRAWPTNKYLFSYIVIANSNLCNLTCSYCRDTLIDKPHGGMEAYNIASVMDTMLKEGLLSPQAKIAWGDGEPVLLKSFTPTMKLAIQHGMTIDLLSNCTIFNEMILDGLLKNKVSILCSVDAGSRECYKLIRGKDLLDKVWDNLGKYTIANSSAISLKYVFVDDNCSVNEIILFIERMKLSGITHLLISQDMYKYRARWSNEVKLMPKHISDGIITMLYEASKHDINAELQSNYFIPQDIWRLKLLFLQKLLEAPFTGSEKLANEVLSSFSSDLIDDLNNLPTLLPLTPLSTNNDSNQFDAIVKRLDEIESSISWKVTAPLRWAGRFFRGK